MLRKVLAISGRPGLFQLVSQGKNMLIVESLSDKKRTPAYSHDKIISLHDISIYTEAGEEPLYNVFAAMEKKTNGEKMNTAELDTFFDEVLPTYDRERVHKSDIKKIFSWFNILIDAGFKDIKKEEAAADESAE